MIKIRELRIGDIITKEIKYEGYKYSIVDRYRRHQRYDSTQRGV